MAGATGVLGRALVPRLVARGHEVVGMTRSASKQHLVRRLGARPVVAGALEPDAVAQTPASAEPEVIVHQLTALSGPTRVRDARRPDRSSAATMTNRLRTEATNRPSTGAIGEVDRTWALCGTSNESGNVDRSSTRRVASTRMDVQLRQLSRKPLPEWLAGR